MRQLRLKDDNTPCLRSLSLRVEEAERLGDYVKAIGLLEMLVAHEREACAEAAEDVVPQHTECGNKIAAAIRART